MEIIEKEPEYNIPNEEYTRRNEVEDQISDLKDKITVSTQTEHQKGSIFFKRKV